MEPTRRRPMPLIAGPLSAVDMSGVGVRSNGGRHIPRSYGSPSLESAPEGSARTFWLHRGCGCLSDHKSIQQHAARFFCIERLRQKQSCEKPFNGPLGPFGRCCAESLGSHTRTASQPCPGQSSNLQGQRLTRCAARPWLSTQWLSWETCSRAVGPGLVLALRLVQKRRRVKNTGPKGEPRQLPYEHSEGRMGRDHVVWPDFPSSPVRGDFWDRLATMDTKKPFSSGGWFMFRPRPFHPGSFGTLLHKLDSYAGTTGLGDGSRRADS